VSRENDLDHDDGPWFEPALTLCQERLLHLGKDFAEIRMSVLEITLIKSFLDIRRQVYQIVNECLEGMDFVCLVEVDFSQGRLASMLISGN